MSSLPIRVLLVDDDEDDRLFFAEAIKEIPLDCHLVTFSEGIRLIERLKLGAELPHVIFLDLNMPIKDGIECLKEIRQHASFANLKVVIYSTSFNPESANLLRDHGANYYVRKPPSFLAIKNIVYHALQLILGHEKESKDKYVLKLQ